MKKVFICSIALFLLLAASLFANRNEVEKFLKDYEAYVVDMEALAKKSSVTVSELLEVTEKYESKYEHNIYLRGRLMGEFTDIDTRRFEVLFERWAKANELIVKKLTYF